MTVLDDARAIQSDLIGLRHALHRIPELGLELPRTQAVVLDALAGLDLEITTGTGCSSVTAVVRGGGSVRDHERRTVLLRGDMDALPLTEQVDVDFRSEHEGRMHACGHDLHTSMLVGAARILAARRDQLHGDVVLMFQPGEEDGGGARVMISEGVLDAAGRRPDAAWALHVMSSLTPPGHVVSRRGPLMAASSGLHVTVRGVGGHGSAPHRAKDPVPVAAEMVVGLQTLLSRTVSAFSPSVRRDDPVLRRGRPRRPRAGHRAVLRGDRRSARGVEVDARFERYYPVTVNDSAAAGIAEKAVSEVLGESRWEWLSEPITGSEDFSYVLQAVPGAMLFLGACVDAEGWEQSPISTRRAPRSPTTFSPTARRCKRTSPFDRSAGRWICRQGHRSADERR